jgi:hypothetical protein
MHDSLFMHMGEGRGNLVNVLPDLSLLKEYVLLFALLNKEFEVAFLSPLDGNKKLVELVVDEPV